MDLTSCTVAPSTARTTPAKRHGRFKRPVKVSGAYFHLLDTQAPQGHKKQPFETPIEALRQNMAAVLVMLDRIEAKVDLLPDKAVQHGCAR